MKLSKLKKPVAMLVAMLFVLTMFPVGAFAADPAGPSTEYQIGFVRGASFHCSTHGGQGKVEISVNGGKPQKTYDGGLVFLYLGTVEGVGDNCWKIVGAYEGDETDDKSKITPLPIELVCKNKKGECGRTDWTSFSNSSGSSTAAPSGANVQFVHVGKPEFDYRCSVNVSKFLDGDIAKVADVFEFILEKWSISTNEWVQVGDSVFSNEEGIAAFKDAISEVGSYKISEVNLDTSSYENLTKEITFEVTLDDLISNRVFSGENFEWNNKTVDKPLSLTIGKAAHDTSDNIGDRKFSFTIEFGELADLSQMKYNEDVVSKVADKANTYTFKLAIDDEVTFKDIPKGTSYTITEQEEDYYKAYNGDDVAPTNSITKALFENTTHTFKNDLLEPGIDVEKTITSHDEGAKAQSGDLIVYKVVTTNTGELTLTNVTLTEMDGFDGPYATEQDAQSGSNKAGANLGTLEPTDSRTVYYTRLVTANDKNLTEISNTVKATGQYGPDEGDTIDDEDTVTIELIHPKLTITKATENDVTVFDDGATVVFVITVTNEGDAVAKNVKLTDNWNTLNAGANSIEYKGSGKDNEDIKINPNDFDVQPEESIDFYYSVKVEGNSLDQIKANYEEQLDIAGKNLSNAEKDVQDILTAIAGKEGELSATTFAFNEAVNALNETAAADTPAEPAETEDGGEVAPPEAPPVDNTALEELTAAYQEAIEAINAEISNLNGLLVTAQVDLGNAQEMYDNLASFDYKNDLASSVKTYYNDANFN